MMSRMNRDLEFIQIRIQKDDHDYLMKLKRGSEQIDAIFHRVVQDYRHSELAAAIENYDNQVKSTQFWMMKYKNLQTEVDAQRQGQQVLQ